MNDIHKRIYQFWTCFDTPFLHLIYDNNSSFFYTFSFLAIYHLSFFLQGNVLSFQILDYLGIDFKIEKDGKEIPVRLPVGERVRKTVKGKMYDTKRCLPVADSFYADGENKYRPENGQADQ